MKVINLGESNSVLNSFIAEIRDALAELGREMELSIRIQREEIFNAMHSI